MGSLLGLLFLTFVMNAKMVTAQGVVYSSPDTALRFAQCLIEKMSESQFFTIDDRNTIMEVANVMAEAMKHRYQTNISIKILVIAFVTSMADVVIHEDPAKNTHRKGVYASSLEQCSLSSAGYVDPEFIMEALRIVASIEHSKLSKIVRSGEAMEAKAYHSNTNVPQPNVFNPSVVQPSPVQIPRMVENFNPNDRTSFEQPKNPINSYPSILNSRPNPQFNPQATSGFSSGSILGSALQAPNFPGFPPVMNPGSIVQATSNTGFSVGSLLQTASNMGSSLDSNAGRVPLTGPNAGFLLGSNAESMLQSASKTEFSSGSNVGSLLQQGNDKVILPALDLPQTKFLAEPFQAAPSSGGLNIPQTKESSVVVIPPSGNKQIAQIEDFHDNPLLKSAEMGFQPPRYDNVPKPQEVMPSPAFLPQTGERTINVQPNPALERTIQDILIESPVFRNTFNFDTPQENAVNLARSITEQSLKNYNLDLINKAVVAVSEEIAKVSYRTPENYALALSNALVAILKLYNLPLFVDGSLIANNFLSNLDNAKKFSSQPIIIGEQPISDGSDNPEEKPVDIDFQVPPFAPEDTDGERFSEILRKYLSQSNEFSQFFCANIAPEDRTKIFFAVIKSSLGEFGLQVSLMAATAATSALAEQPVEWLCSNYAQIISDSISDVLEENAVVEGANAQDISNKMISNLNQQIQELELPDVGNGGKFPLEYSTEESYEMPTLQPSFPSNSANSNLNQPLAESVTSVSQEINYRTSDYLPGQTNDSDSAPYIFNGPPSPIQMSPVEKLKPESDEYTVPITTPYATEITDELTDAITFTEAIIDFWELTSTESSDTVWPAESDDAKDQESLTSHLLESFQTALDALFSTMDEHESPSNSSDISLAIDKAEDSESHVSLEKVDEIRPQTNSPRKRQRNERRRKRKTTVSDVVTPSIIEADTKNINYPQQIRSEDITDSGDSSDQHQAGYKVFSEQLDASSSYSEDSSAKRDFVELHPSFPGPPSTDTSTNQTLTPSFDTNSHDTESRDSSILVARSVSQKAAETIASIRSGNLNMESLCVQLNEFASMVNIPPLDYCMEMAAIDYILNVLMSTIKITKGV